MCLLCWFRIVRNFGQALSRILAFAVVEVAASVHRQPFVPLHRATALCGCLYASLHNDFGRPPSCILARPAQCEFAPPSTKKAGLCLFRHNPAFFGADGGGRTRTVLLPADFESASSANSNTPASHILSHLPMSCPRNWRDIVEGH